MRANKYISKIWQGVGILTNKKWWHWTLHPFVKIILDHGSQTLNPFFSKPHLLKMYFLDTLILRIKYLIEIADSQYKTKWFLSFRREVEINCIKTYECVKKKISYIFSLNQLALMGDFLKKILKIFLKNGEKVRKIEHINFPILLQ